MKFKSVCRTPGFTRDLKKLAKRFPTLENDLNLCVDSNLFLYHKLHIDNNSVFVIPGLGIPDFLFYKVRKFACRALKGTGVKSGIRVVYTYYEREDRIDLIEIYFKGDRENENRERLREYLKKYCLHRHL